MRGKKHFSWFKATLLLFPMVHVCISRGLLLECGGVEVRGYFGGGGVRSSQSFAHGSDRVSCMLDTCHCETLIWCDSEHRGLQLNGTHPEVAQRGGCWAGSKVSWGHCGLNVLCHLSNNWEWGFSPPLTLCNDSVVLSVNSSQMWIQFNDHSCWHEAQHNVASFS